MKAEYIKERPTYELLKQNDIVHYYHLQLPRWLLIDRKYSQLSLEAKFIYTLLFNRFQLSKHNGWVNDNGEVFVIYTRNELSECLHISEKRISAAMNELKHFALIWERRCGRGFANQIYLANVKLSVEDAVNAKGGSLDPTEPASKDEDLRTDETAGLDETEQENENALYTSNINSNVDKHTENSTFLSVTSETAGQEPPFERGKNSQNGSLRTSVLSVQEPPKQPPIYKDLKEKDLSYYNQSQSKSSHFFTQARTDGRTDADDIDELLEQAEIDSFPDDDAAVIKDAIERLYFMQSIHIGSAVYPNERIRSHLWRLDALVIQDAINKITKNTAKIRNSSAYVVTVLFNTIMEYGSDLIVDPYLNHLRSYHRAEALKAGGG